MIFLLRLASGDCVVTSARNEAEAREQSALIREPGDEILSVREIPKLALRLTPSEAGTLDVERWDDATLDDILRHEYPILNEAIQNANRMSFLPSPDPSRPILEQLRVAYQENTEVIREGIRQEQQRAVPVRASKAAHK